MKRTIVLDIVGLEYEHLESLPNISKIAENGTSAKMEPVFPAVTCTVQASIFSGKYPQDHGIIANGMYDRNLHNVSFWEQPSNLVQSQRVWDILKQREPSTKTAALFLQNTMYTNSDIVVTPRPLHFDNGIVMWCYSKPVGFYEQLVGQFGEFNLASYWGPIASHKSSEWICNAAKYTLEKENPDLTFVYIPHIDYSAQRFGKNSSQVRDDLHRADDIVGTIVEKTSQMGTKDSTEFVILSEYGFTNVNRSIPLNLKLRDMGLLAIREIQGKEYLDFEYSKAFAMVDHQVAHIYIKKGFEDKVKDLLLNTSGVDKILSTSKEKREYSIDHERSGEIIAISEKDSWFSYYWWYEKEKAPPFAGNVDIHRKPGYDPTELFVDMNTRQIQFDRPDLVKGSHGRPADRITGESYALFISSGKSKIKKNGDGIVHCTNVIDHILGK